MEAPEPRKILVMGGDSSTWMALSNAMGKRATQIFVTQDLDRQSLMDAHAEIDAVILVASNGADPQEALRRICEARLHRRTVVIADATDAKAAASVVSLGIGGLVTRGSPPEILHAAVHQVIAGGIFYDSPAADLFGSLSLPAEPSQGLDMGVARALASALELKDTYTGGHAERVTALALRLSEATGLTDVVGQEDLKIAFLLHDVGKIGIPESILGKPGALTDTERRVLQTHPILGERVVAPLGGSDVIRQVIRHHHERWDGRGYPDGLSGHDIPAAARVFAVADVFDAMTSVRPYRDPLPFENAMREIMFAAGEQFDPSICALAEEMFLAASIEMM